MKCAHSKNQIGFTLVEISIVMIIIGLLIGGTFGSMKLIDNMRVSRSIQDLKSLESAALAFKDIYGRLPGDIASPSSRLPDCTVAPCATGGNGNRVIDTTAYNEILTDGMERFTFWHQLQASGLMNLSISNQMLSPTGSSYGESVPEFPIGGGYRLANYNGTFAVAGAHRFERTVAFLTMAEYNILMAGAAAFGTRCTSIQAIDNKIDDGMPYNGIVVGWACATTTLTSPYVLTSSGAMIYDLKGF